MWEQHIPLGSQVSGTELVLDSLRSSTVAEGKKGVWLKLLLEQSDLVPIAVKVLVVEEKYCSPATRGLWKIPTGFIIEAEEIYTRAIRGVKEETGIDTEFIDVIAFRHAHNVAFEKSDLFFICMLRPLSVEITVDVLEIEAAKWMPLVEFVEQPLIQEDFHVQEDHRNLYSSSGEALLWPICSSNSFQVRWQVIFPVLQCHGQGRYQLFQAQHV